MKGKEDQQIWGKGVKPAEMKCPSGHFLPATGAASLVRRSMKMHSLVLGTHSSEHSLPQEAPNPK